MVIVGAGMFAKLAVLWENPLKQQRGEKSCRLTQAFQQCTLKPSLHGEEHFGIKVCRAMKKGASGLLMTEDPKPCAPIYQAVVLHTKTNGLLDFVVGALLAYGL